MNEYDGRQFVGIDLHRRRTVIVRQSETGEQLETRSDRERPAGAGAGRSVRPASGAGGGARGDLRLVLGGGRAGRAPGARVHLAHPLGVKGFTYRRVKNDVRDAADLADLLRMGRLPEAWIAPPRGAGAARAGPPPRQAGRGALRVQGRRARRAGQAGPARAGDGPVRRRGPAAARAATAAPLDRAYRARVNAYLRVDRHPRHRDRRLADGWIAARLATDRAIGRSRPIPGSGRSGRRCSSPRSATSPASPPRGTCAPGPGSPRAIASPTPPCTAARSPSRAPPSCAGPRSRPCNASRDSAAGWSRTRRRDHRPPRPQHRHRRGRPPPAHPGLLRPARRPHPRPPTTAPTRHRGRHDLRQ